MNKNLEQAYEKFTEDYASKPNTVPWFLAQFKTHLSKNITLEDWNNLQQNLKNIISDGESVKKLLDNIFKYLSEDNSYTDEKIDELITNLKRSKVSIYTPSYSTAQGDEVVIRKRLTYDILTQSFDNSVIIAGYKYIAIRHVKGGPWIRVKLFDFISNTYYETSDIDTSNLTDYNTISFKVTSYYDKSKIDSLMLQKADKSKTYTKTETDSKTIQNLTINYNDYTDIAYQLLTMLANETINPYTTYYVNKRFEVVIHSSYSTNYGVYIKDITHPTRYYKTNFIDITTNFSINDVQITRVEWYNTNEVDNKLTRNNLISAIGNATESLSGVMSAEDKKNLNTLVALLQDDSNNVVDTIKEVLAIFNQYPEGADLVSALAGKVDKTTYKTKVKALEENILDLDNTKIEIDSLTAKNNIKNYQEVLWLGSDEIPEIPTQLPFGSSTDLITFLEGLKTLWRDINSNLIEQYGYDRVVFLGYVNSIKKMVKCTIRYQEASGTYVINVHSSIYKANVKECISLNTNKRYKLVNDTYTTPQEPSYFLEEIPYLVANDDNMISLVSTYDDDCYTTVGPECISTHYHDSGCYIDNSMVQIFNQVDANNYYETFASHEYIEVRCNSGQSTSLTHISSSGISMQDSNIRLGLYPGDGFLEMRNESSGAEWYITLNGMRGQDDDENEFNFNWADLANAGKQVYNYTEDGGVVSLNTYSLSICPYANGPMAEISAEDGYIKLGGGEGDAYIGILNISPDGIGGEDRDGNSYDLQWKDLANNSGSSSQYFNFSTAETQTFGGHDAQSPQRTLQNDTIVNWGTDLQDEDTFGFECNTNKIAIQVENAPSYFDINFVNATASGAPCVINRTHFRIDGTNHINGVSNGYIGLEGISDLDVSGSGDYLILTYDVDTDTILIDHAYYGEI